jgi:hypothetical protein
MLLDDLLETATLMANLEPNLYLRPAAALHRLVEETTKYVIHDEVIISSTHLSVTKPSNLLANLEFARRPHANMWYEFVAAPRVAGLREGGLEPHGLQPHRIGLLLTDHPNFPDNSLAGRALIVWRHNGHPSFACDICFSDLLWDFRPEWTEWRTPAEFAQERNWALGATGKGKSSIAWIYKDNPKELDAHATSIGHFRPYGSWFHAGLHEQLRDDPTDKKLQRMIAASMGDAFSECSTLQAILLLFNSSNALTHKPVNLDKINKHRAKNKKPLLRSYNQTVFRVNRAERRAKHLGQPVQHGVVLQKVRGHFRSRVLTDGTKKIFWVPEFERGDIAYGIGPSISKMRRMSE